MDAAMESSIQRADDELIDAAAHPEAVTPTGNRPT
jgi:hypothetical protein